MTFLDYIAPIRSDLKVQILLSLLDGEKKISELKSVIKSRETTILHILKEFKTNKLITRTSGVCTLTSLGIMEAQICKHYSTATEAIKNFREFWLTHDISGLPECSITNVGALKNSQLITASGIDLGEVHKNFLNILASSNLIKGVSPIFHPDFIPTFSEALTRGCTIDLIVTNDVWRRHCHHGVELLQNILKTTRSKYS